MKRNYVFRSLLAVALAFLVAVSIPEQLISTDVIAAQTSRSSRNTDTSNDASGDASTQTDPDKESTSTTEALRGAEGGRTTADTSANKAQDNTTDMSDAIHVASLEDLQNVAGKAHYDQWSTGKYVVLDVDLDLSNSEVYIAYFNGTFDGQGHTIRGLSAFTKASAGGFFEVVGTSGLVENLNVIGTLAPSDTQNMQGGIVGVNYGTVRNCTFNGSVSANDQVGGIVGRNETSGIVDSCTATGNITGDSYTGGIVGYNAGTIQQCTSWMNVNTTYSDTTVTLDQVSNTIENVLMTGRVNSTENVTARTDTGGIAGYSSGVVSSCTNDGTVGYDHVGYNVGGITGRTSGYIQDCENHGSIYGRKDVGGIVGQQQPYLALQFSEDTLQSLEDEISALQNSADSLVDVADSSVGSVNSGVSRLSGLASSAGQSVKTIADQTQNDLDSLASDVNAAGSTLQDAMNQTSSAAGELGTQINQIASNATTLNNTVDAYLNSAQLSDADRTKIRNDYNSLQSGIGSIQSAMNSLLSILNDQSRTASERASEAASAIKTLRAAADAALKSAQDLVSWIQNHQSVLPGIDNLLAQIAEIQKEIQNIVDGLSTLDSLGVTIENTISSAGSLDTTNATTRISLDRNGSNVQDFIISWNNWQDPLDMINTDLQQALAGLVNSNAGIFTQDEISQLNNFLNALLSQQSQVKNALADLQSLSGGLSGDISSLPGQISRIQQDLNTIINSLSSEANNAANMMNILAQHLDAIPDLQSSGIYSALQNLINAINGTSGLATQAQSILGELAGINLSVSGVSSVITDAGNSLYSSLSGMNSAVQSIGNSLGSAASNMASGIHDLNSHLQKIADLLEDSYKEQLSGNNGSITDNSDEGGYNGMTQGRTTRCTNLGTVSADNNVGGIIGTVGVEYDLDPEEDIQQLGDSSLNFDFFARAVVDHCVNDGTITSKNNYAGGVAGRMELGFADADESYGRVIGGADYTGGISGYSTGTIRNCYAKCDLSGSRYIGGIAGYAVKLSNNVSMITISSSSQYAGAIAGRVKDVNTDIKNNVFISTKLHGIDDISYKGIAQGTTHKALMEGDNVPADYTKTRVVFEADDNVVAILYVNYGDSLDQSKFPVVPAKDGFVGEWEQKSLENLKSDTYVPAIYTRKLDAIAAADKRDGGAAVFLAEGNFIEGDQLVFTQETPQEDETERWHIRIPDDGQVTHTFRYLAKDKSTDNTTIYLVNDNGSRQALDTGTNGKYLTFTADGNDLTFSAKTVEADDRIRDIAIGGTAAAVIVLLIVRIRRRRKGRKKKQTAARQ